LEIENQSSDTKINVKQMDSNHLQSNKMEIRILKRNWELEKSFGLHTPYTTGFTPKLKSTNSFVILIIQ